VKHRFCMACRYFAPRLIDGECDLGECRRRAPEPFKVDLPREGQVNFVAVWPLVRSDAWCWQFKRAKTSEAKP